MPISQKRFTEIAHEAYREGYANGFEDGTKIGFRGEVGGPRIARARETLERDPVRGGFDFSLLGGSNPSKRGGKRPRKLSKWQQFVKKNSKFPRFKYKSGAKKGRINLKALGVAYRKTKRR